MHTVPPDKEQHNCSIHPLGDGALLVDFGNRIDASLNNAVLRLYQQLRQNPFPGMTELAPAYSSLAVFYDVATVLTIPGKGSTAYEKAAAAVLQLAVIPTHASPTENRIIRVPVCYTGAFAPDLQALALEKGLTTEAVIQLHGSQSYRVYMIGFLPGFAYMGEVPEAIAMPRRAEPRTRVAAGSVGIAGRQTGIYPVDAPGGWQIIGRTPLSLFNKTLPNPVLLQPGDEVIFYPITAHEFDDYPNRHS